MTDAPSLAEWLMVRIADDEAAVEGASNWRPVYDTDAQIELTHDGLMINPARVLAECEAKRRIVETCTTYLDETDYTNTGGYDDTLRALASVYADHEGFREEWR